MKKHLKNYGAVWAVRTFSSPLVIRSLILTLCNFFKASREASCNCYQSSFTLKGNRFAYMTSFVARYCYSLSDVIHHQNKCEVIEEQKVTSHKHKSLNVDNYDTYKMPLWIMWNVLWPFPLKVWNEKTFKSCFYVSFLWNLS